MKKEQQVVVKKEPGQRTQEADLLWTRPKVEQPQADGSATKDADDLWACFGVPAPGDPVKKEELSSACKEESPAPSMVKEVISDWGCVPIGMHWRAILE